MNYSIRELKRDENKILDTFLYEAIFIPEGVTVPSKDIINKPDLQVYVKDFGENKGDLCLVAQVADEIVGAVWVRIMNDYGHIDNETPSFAISLLKEYRNYGIGTELMKHMITKLLYFWFTAKIITKILAVIGTAVITIIVWITTRKD